MNPSQVDRHWERRMLRWTWIGWMTLILGPLLLLAILLILIKTQSPIG